MEALQIFYNNTFHPPLFDYYGNPIQYPAAVLELSNLSEDELIQHLTTPSFRQAWCLRYISVILKEQHHYHRAIKYLAVSLKMLQSVNKIYGSDYFLRNFASELAEDYMNIHDFAKALEALKVLLDATYSAIGRETDSKVTAYILCSCGGVLTKLQRVEEADTYLFKSFQMYKRLLGENSQDLQVARVLRHIGTNYRTNEQYEKALEFYQDSFDMYQHILASSSDKRDIALVLIDMGDTHILMDNSEEAQTKLVLAREILEAFHGVQAPRQSIAMLYRSLGRNYLMQEKNEEAKTCFEVALNAYERCYRFVRPKHPAIMELEDLIQAC